MTGAADLVVVGAGIIGLTVARAWKRRDPAASITLVEKEVRLGVHASGRNSGVMHTGIYYPAGTLKARLCRNGARAMLDYVREQSIAHRQDGKVVVATSEENARGLEALMANARAAGVAAERIDGPGIRDLEPHARAEFGGIHCPETAVIDSRAVLDALRRDLVAEGVQFRMDEPVIAIDDDRKVVTTAQGRYPYGAMVNAAGAYADRVAHLAGVGRRFRLVPFKGLYHRLTPAANHRIRGSVYPVPDPALPFLGIHFTRVISGEVYVGPTAIPALGRENYGILQGARPVETCIVAGRLLGLYLKNTQNFRRLVHREIPHYSRRRFLASARTLVDRLDPDWVEATGKVGIRPQLIDVEAGKLEMDFVVERGANSTHVLNAISPAFTSSFAFAELVVEIAHGH